MSEWMMDGYPDYLLPPKQNAPEKTVKCPNCTLPILANDEFCVSCNHNLKVMGGVTLNGDRAWQTTVRCYRVQPPRPRP